MLLTENKDGLPWDFDQARIFTWNVKRHRYETAYRERRLVGVFPVSVGSADFGKRRRAADLYAAREGRRRQDAGAEVQNIGPIVRGLSPEEEQAKAAGTGRKRR